MLSRRLSIGFALALLGITGCGEDPIPPDRFTFSLGLDNGPDGSCDANDTCDGFPITCGAVVGVRLLDLVETADEVPVVRDTACVRVPEDPAGLTLCDLGRGKLNVNFTRVPRERGMIEVVVWPDTGTGDPVCPALDFDVFGRVSAEQFPNPERPEPSFARRVFFNFAGQTESATIALGCHNPQLIGPSCLPISTRVSARVFNFNDPALSVNETVADDLDVQVGEPQELGEGEFEIVDSTRMTGLIQPPLAPLWQTTLDMEFADDADVCLQVRDLDEPGTVTATHCSRVAGGVALDLVGYFVALRDLDNILEAADIQEFPDRGIVIGRVIDTNFQPVAGVSVIPDTGAEVQYVGPGFTTTEGQTVTSSLGYFLSTDAVFTTLWRAERGDGLESQNPPPRAGLLNNNVTVVVLSMGPTVSD